MTKEKPIGVVTIWLRSLFLLDLKNKKQLVKSINKYGNTGWFSTYKTLVGFNALVLKTWNKNIDS